jgi:hypothetical protein
MKKMNTHEKLMVFTKYMPMKQINIDGKPYLQRYYVGTFMDGPDLWLHRILTGDGERHLHSHPFNFSTSMLAGAYTEEYLKPDGEKDFNCVSATKSDIYTSIFSQIYMKKSYAFVWQLPSHRDISVFDWHRIADAMCDTWTACIIEPERLPCWFFKDDDGKIESVKSSPREWWHDYKTRPDKGYSDDDNSKKSTT